MPAATPSISVIMPVYNTAPYLRRALDSVCNQSFRDLEILCINDGSTDQSPAILAEYAARDPRIRVITHEKNKGVAGTVNSGIDAATGKTFAIVDSDDAIGKNFYAELWATYSADDCDIAKGRLVERNLNGDWREAYLNAGAKKQASFSAQWTTAIYSTDFIRKNNLKLSPHITCGQELFFLYCLMGYEPKINFCDTAIYYYFRNAASMTTSDNDEYYLSAHITIASLMKQYIPTYSYESQRKKMFTNIILFLDYSLNRRFSKCDGTPHLGDLKAIFADDEFYAPQKNFPLLQRAHSVKNIQELKMLLETFYENHRKNIMLTSLRKGLKTKLT